MHRLPAFLALVWLAAAPASSADLAAANQRYAAKDFAAAAAGYEQLLATSGPDATLLYNLGNARQQLKQYGPAILAYEQARLLTPRDPDLIANLASARKAATAFAETPAHPKLDALATRLSRDEWSWLVAGAALFLGIIAVIAGAIGFRRRGARQAAVVSAAFAALVISAGSAALFWRRGEARLGIVLAENATVRLSPFESATAVGTPGPGKTVRLGAASGGFHYVSVPGTTLEGWMADKDVAAVMPPP